MDKEALAMRFGQCEPAVQEWAEQSGYANLRQRIESGALIGQQAATTLSLLLAGLAGALAFGVKVLEPGSGLVALAAAALCVYLALLAAILVIWCLRVEAAPMLHNQPASLLIPGVALRDLRAGELANLEERIQQQAAINNRRAAVLNRVRYAAIACPVVPAIVAAACYWRG